MKKFFQKLTNWELWNFYSYPKWIYHIPYVGVLHVFEMPLAGYGGYLFFGPELYALYNLLSTLLPRSADGVSRAVPLHVTPAPSPTARAWPSPRQTQTISGWDERQ